MLGNVALFYAFWILIFHCCDSSAIAVSSPVQAVVGWNANFNMQLDPYPSIDSVIQIIKNGTLIMRVKGTKSLEVAERFEFTGNTFENRISFILRNVTLGDAGKYNATESGLSSGGEQMLIVKVAPSKPQIIAITGSAVLGSDYRLNCSSVSNSVPRDHGLTMMSEWKVNDQLITSGGHFKVQGTELTFASITRQDNNIKLTCVAYEDSLAKSVPSNELVIDVKYGPGSSVNLGSNPSALIVNLHQRAPDITCSAICNPPCDYRWYHNRTVYSTGATLSLGVVENKTSGGNYTCEAYNNILGLVQSSNTSVSINVYCHPRTDSKVPPETKVYKKRYEAAFLRYTVISYPLPKFKWVFLGNSNESKDLPDSASIYVNGQQSELRFTSLNINDFGNYSVVADNSLPPSAREVFEIIPAGVPEVPSNITVREVTENSITVQWVAGYNDGPKQTFNVFVSTGDFTRNFTASDPGYGNIGTVVIKGLSTSTKYRIYMSASNPVGSSNMTEAIFVVTLEE